MAKRKVIWSNTAIKILYALLEADIRKGNGKEVSIKVFQTIYRSIKAIKKNPEEGIRTTEKSIYGLLAGSVFILYSHSEMEIVIHTFWVG